MVKCGSKKKKKNDSKKHLRKFVRSEQIDCPANDILGNNIYRREVYIYRCNPDSGLLIFHKG